MDRRTFLKQMGRCGLLAASTRAVGSALARGQQVDYNLPKLENLPATRPVAPEATSVVARALNPMILAGPRLHENALLTALEHGIRLALDAEHPVQAWRAMLKPRDVVGIKFDAVGFETLQTTPVLAGQLVRSLEKAGFKREQIVLIDVPTQLAEELGTRPRKFGWQPHETVLGERKVKLAAVLDQITALVNVPFLKTDDVCGMAGCIKNASLPFVQRQAPWYENACSPHLADILALPAIRSKLRVHIVNGLRGVFDKGPDVHRACVWSYAGLLVSTDPVAADAVTLDVLNARRAAADLPALGDDRGRLPLLRAAARRGLGTDDPDYIRVVEPPAV